MVDILSTSGLLQEGECCIYEYTEYPYVVYNHQIYMCCIVTNMPTGSHYVYIFSAPHIQTDSDVYEIKMLPNH